MSVFQSRTLCWLRLGCLLLLGLVVAGCASRKIDWSSRVGSYTYDQAVRDMGPPDKSAKLDDDSTVADWMTVRGTTTMYSGAGYGYPYYSPPIGFASTSPDYFIRLTFDTSGTLTGWKKYAR